MHLASVLGCLIISLQDEKSPLGRLGGGPSSHASRSNNSPGAITQARRTAMIPADAREVPLFASAESH